MSGRGQTIHANAVLAGAKAVVIRGAAASGKSQLTLDMIDAAPAGRLAMLVADDRVRLTRAGGRILAAPLAEGRGLIEVRGLGIAARPFEPLAQVGLVADLCPADDIERLPEAESLRTLLLGVEIPRIAIAIRHPRAAQLCWMAMRQLECNGDLAAFSSVAG